MSLVCLLFDLFALFWRVVHSLDTTGLVIERGLVAQQSLIFARA